MIQGVWRTDHRVARWTATAFAVGYYALTVIPKVFR